MPARNRITDRIATARLLEKFKWGNPTQHSELDVTPWNIEIELGGFGTAFKKDGVQYRNHFSILHGEFNALDFAEKLSKEVPEYPVKVTAHARIRAIFKDGKKTTDMPSLKHFYQGITDEDEQAWKNGDKFPSVSTRLDRLAGELEQIDPRIALALDNVSDQLEKISGKRFAGGYINKVEYEKHIKDILRHNPEIKDVDKFTVEQTFKETPADFLVDLRTESVPDKNPDYLKEEVEKAVKFLEGKKWPLGGTLKCNPHITVGHMNNGSAYTFGVNIINDN